MASLVVNTTMRSHLYIVTLFFLLTSFHRSDVLSLGVTNTAVSILEKQSGSIEIIVSGFLSTEGQINIALYNSEGTFNQIEKVYYKNAYTITSKSVIIKLNDIPAGEYALALFHDVNKNLQIDKNFFGIPKEGFAFSNNASGYFGPPGWSSSKFTVKSGEKCTQKVSLIHY